MPTKSPKRKKAPIEVARCESCNGPLYEGSDYNRDEDGITWHKKCPPAQPASSDHKRECARLRKALRGAKYTLATFSQYRVADDAMAAIDTALKETSK